VGLRHTDVYPVVEEFELSVRLAASHGFLAGHNVGNDGAFLGGLPLASLPG
jgi:hypothetical protein